MGLKFRVSYRDGYFAFFDGFDFCLAINVGDGGFVSLVNGYGGFPHRFCFTANNGLHQRLEDGCSLAEVYDFGCVYEIAVVMGIVFFEADGDGGQSIVNDVVSFGEEFIEFFGEGFAMVFGRLGGCCLGVVVANGFIPCGEAGGGDAEVSQGVWR